MKIPASSYVGRHAELYDILYSSKPYSEEAAFIHRYIQQYAPGSKRLLELACGTGTHALLLEKYDYQIIATDYSKDMLSCAQKKIKKEKSKIEIRQQDMRTLDVPERPFDAIYCLFDSIGYVATNENILLVLQNVHDHLKPGGLFLFEFWHAAAMIRHYDPMRVRRCQIPNGEIVRISETTIDYHNQLCSVLYSIYEMNNDGSYASLQETHVNRFFQLQEMKLFLQQAKLKPLKWFSGFQENELINDETWHIFAVAQKESKN